MSDSLHERIHCERAKRAKKGKDVNLILDATLEDANWLRHARPEPPYADQDPVTCAADAEGDMITREAFQLPIRKSTRHSKIAGDFGEALVLYCLSKYGFECARIDHTGIDLIARNPHTKELMGISVKSRTRLEGGKSKNLRIPNGDLVKASAACDAFGCVPYVAIVIDDKETIRVFMLGFDHLMTLCKTESGVNWRMREPHVSKYTTDPEIKIFEFKSSIVSWWSESGTQG
jgi:hypothetical protein